MKDAYNFDLNRDIFCREQLMPLYNIFSSIAAGNLLNISKRFEILQMGHMPQVLLQMQSAIRKILPYYRHNMQYWSLKDKIVVVECFVSLGIYDAALFTDFEKEIRNIIRQHSNRWSLMKAL